MSITILWLGHIKLGYFLFNHHALYRNVFFKFVALVYKEVNM